MGAWSNIDARKAVSVGKEHLEGILGGVLFRLVGVNFVVFLMFSYLVVVWSIEVEVD